VIRAQKTRSDIAHTMGVSLKTFGGTFFSGQVSGDAKDPDHYAVYLGQAGLGLPDRDYYLEAGFAPQKANTNSTWPRC
jgi:putative endopeptidase